MGDFIQSGGVKTAVRTPAAPIADVAAFAEAVDDIITNNPFGCMAYVIGTENHAAVEKACENYTGRIACENTEAETVDRVWDRCPTGVHRERHDRARQRRAGFGHGRHRGARHRGRLVLGGALLLRPERRGLYAELLADAADTLVVQRRSDQDRRRDVGRHSADARVGVSLSVSNPPQYCLQRRGQRLSRGGRAARATSRPRHRNPRDTVVLSPRRAAGGPASTLCERDVSAAPAVSPAGFFFQSRYRPPTRR